MAAGEAVVRVIEAMPPAANFATLDVRVGGSTPAENVNVFDFDDTTVEYMDFKCELNGYDGGGLTFVPPWSATSGTTGSVVWGIGIRRMEDDVDDIDSAHAYVNQSATDPAPSASGELSYPSVIFSSTEIDSWANGEVAIVRIQRTASSTGDTLSGDAELWNLSGKEST